VGATKCQEILYDLAVNKNLMRVLVPLLEFNLIGKSDPARAWGDAAGDGAVRRMLAGSTMPGTHRALVLGLCRVVRGPASQGKVLGLMDFRLK
jgi:hypothetical protein